MAERIPIRRLGYHLIQDTPAWLRALFALGILLINIVVAFLAAQRQLTLVVYLFLGIGLVLTFMRWPSLGLIVAALAGMIITYQGPSGLNMTMVLVALLLGLWLLDMIVLQRKIHLAPSRTVWPLFAFLFAALFSFGVGQLPWFTFTQHAPLGAQLGGLSVFVLSAATFLLVANQVRNLAWLSWMTWAFLALAALSILLKFVFPDLGLPTDALLAPIGTVFVIWLVALAFSQAMFNRDLHPGWRLALGGLVLITLYFYFILRFEHKSGWLPLLVCMLVIIGFRSWRTGLVILLIGGLLAIILSTRLVASENYSLSTRLDAWSIVFQIIKTNPIFGLGFANYYWYTTLFPIRGYEVSFNSHNNYVDIIAQVGLVGLFCYSLFLWQVGRLGWWLRDKVPSGFAQAYVYGALGGLVGMVVAGMLGDWVLPFFYNVGLNGFRSSMLGWLFLGGLVSLEQMVLKTRSG